MANNIPKFLKEMLVSDYGEDLANEIEAGYGADFPVMLRANNLKFSIDALKEKLSRKEIEFKEIPWYENALYLENVKEDEIREINIYSNGEIYLQSLSSMIPAIAIMPKAGENILDMTAAPRTGKLLLWQHFLMMKQ